MPTLEQKSLIVCLLVLVVHCISSFGETHENLAQWHCNELKKWQLPIGMNASPITLAEKYILVGTTASSETDSREGGLLLCVNINTGELVWKQFHKRGLVRDDYPTNGIQSTPQVVDDRVFYVSNRGEVVCLDLDGFRDGKNDGTYTNETVGNTEADIIWLYDVVRKLNVAKMDGYGGGNPVCTPLIFEDKVYVVTGNGCAFFIGGQIGPSFIPKPEAPFFLALDQTSGKLVWSALASTKDLIFSWSSPVVAKVDGQTELLFPGNAAAAH